MASVLPPDILLKIVDKLSLKDKFKTLSISTKWNNSSRKLLEVQTALRITRDIDVKMFRVCDEEIHRIDYKGWLPVSLLKNKKALDATLKKMPKLKAVAGPYYGMSYQFIQSVMKNGIQIECLTDCRDIIKLNSLKHFSGQVERHFLRHLVKLNKDLEVLTVSETPNLIGGNFIWEIIDLERLHTLDITFGEGSNVSEADFLQFISKWEELNRGCLNIVLRQDINIETDAVRGRLATTSNVTLRFIEIAKSYSNELAMIFSQRRQCNHSRCILS